MGEHHTIYTHRVASVADWRIFVKSNIDSSKIKRHAIRDLLGEMETMTVWNEQVYESLRIFID
jgi:hypothetical protein